MNLCASLTYKLFLWSVLFLYGTKLISQNNIVPPPKFVVDSIIIKGNKKTRHGIIMREINFRVNDSLTEIELKEKCLRSQQNLMNTSLFVHDTVSYTIDAASRRVSILISVHERWYFWPSLILQIQDRNFNAWWDQENHNLNRLNYGIGFTLYNILGLNQTLTLVARKGYTEQYGAGYRIPYINKKKTVGLTAGFNFYRNNQIWYKTADNGLVYFTNNTGYVRTESEAKLGITYRHKIYGRNSFEVFLKSSSINDTVTNLNDNYFSSKQTFVQYFSLQYRFSYDTRDYKPYALKGHVFDLALVKDGVGVLQNETPNNFYAFASFKHHFKMGNRWYMMNSVKGRFMPQYVPMYYFNRALGFTELVRGYEYYVVDGQNYGLMKSNIRYQIIKPKTYRLPIDAMKKFTTFSFSLYAGPFIDAGYVVDNSFGKLNPLSNQLLVGGGIGIDFVTYYDYVLRTEFSINKMGQPGIYLHFNAPL
ncbi:MAG TPA: hypothetical protein VNZ49_06810 [Bacteroidia bacterium]|jgi:outer membrane protein assembly factor BamA|nr:hypothetical protein [Bacteroidia bacterium]